MDDLATTRLSSKGQVVIPEAIRKRLGLEPGTEFVVLGEDDTVVLKPIAAPSMREFDEIIAHAAHKFLACAVAAGAAYAVSGDRGLLAASPYRKVTVIRPRALVYTILLQEH